MDFTKVRLLICFCYVCTWLLEDQTVWSQFAFPHNRNTQLLFWECFWKERSVILVFFFFRHCHKESHSSVQLQQQRKEQAESFWGSSYLRSKSVLGYDPDYSKNELCSSSPVLRCFRRTWPWNTAAYFATVHHYSNAQEIKKKSTRVFSLWVVQNPELACHVFPEGFTLRWCFCLAFIGIYEHQHQVGSCHPDHVWMKITNRTTELPACSLPVFQPCIPPSPKLAGSSQVPAAVKLSRET